LATDRAGYGVSQPIGVTVQNSGATGYYAQDGHSACTILELQQLVRGKWLDEMPCTSSQPPNLLVVAPHSSVPFTFAPGNARGDPNSWALGIYRVAMVLRTAPTDAVNIIQVYSTAFQVAG
jgi:hypothetical protein